MQERGVDQSGAAGGDGRGLDLRLSAAELLPVVYDELRRLAAARLAHERAGAEMTLQPTALVHEAFLRLAGPAPDTPAWNSTGHFFGAAALAMRRILIERARKRGGTGVGGVRRPVPLHEVMDHPDAPSVDVFSLDEALTELATLNQRWHDVVMLRFFAGLSLEQTAQVMGVSSMTVKRDWTFARAWLLERIGRAG